MDVLRAHIGAIGCIGLILYRFYELYNDATWRTATSGGQIYMMVIQKWKRLKQTARANTHTARRKQI